MSNLRLIEREITPAELAQMRQGFNEHQLAFGVPLTVQERQTVVAEEGDQFIGCASGLVTEHQWFYLTDLWLQKTYRKQGWGRALLEQLERRLVHLGVRNIYTWTAAYEAPEFYQKQGYEIFGELQDYYAGGYSRFGFRKRLGLVQS